MNRALHALLARNLIKACGGLVSAAVGCRVGKSQLAEYQDPNGETYMPADVIFDLETMAGDPIYSRALFEARREGSEVRDLLPEACEATEAVGELQRDIRLAVEDGVLTPAERRRLTERHQRATAELAQVGELLAREG